MTPRRCRPRTAFVLAGGASLGAMQVGMLRALYERGIAPDVLVGTSAGALNAAFVASRPQTVSTANQLGRAWAAIRREELPFAPSWAASRVGTTTSCRITVCGE
jgi:NTE family protein